MRKGRYTKVPRGLAEMRRALNQQIRLLEEYSERAFARGEDAFLPEVATKLRLLVVRTPMNVPLLLEVADKLGVDLMVTEKGPKRLKDSTGTWPLDTYLDRTTIAVSASDGPISISHRDLIRGWAEQLDGAHADWTLDEHVAIALSDQLSIVRGMGRTMLRQVTRTVLEQAAKIPPEAQPE